MRGTVVSRFVLPLLLLISITVLLWLCYGFASAYRLFGSPAFEAVFLVAALVSTALLFVFVAANLIVRVAFAWLLGSDPTQLQRGLIVAVLTFIAAAAALWYSGLDLSTILTTSALLSAIVGLSVQPMLVSLMSGLTVHRLIRIGDGLLLDGEDIEITSLNWRSVTARRANGSTLIVPNGKLADGSLQILAHDQPARAQVKLDLPTSLAPHRIRKLLTELVDDFAEVDSTQPVVALPVGYEGSKPTTAYRVDFWVRHYAQRAAVEGRVLRRFWYAFQREGIMARAADTPNPQSDLDSARHLKAVTAALRKAAPTRSGNSAASETFAESVLAAGEVLPYDEGERIVVPEHLSGHVFVLLEGELSEIQSAGHNSNAPLPWMTAARAGHALTRAVSLSLIEGALARRIGPYATHAVEKASGGGASLSDVCATVAQEIDDAGARDGFLQEACPATEIISGPGFLFRVLRDSAHRLVPNPPMRAVDYALVLAVPEAALEPGAPLSEKSAAGPKKRGKPDEAAAA